MILYLRRMACVAILIVSGCATKVKLAPLAPDHPANPEGPAGTAAPTTVQPESPAAPSETAPMEHHHGHE